MTSIMQNDIVDIDGTPHVVSDVELTERGPVIKAAPLGDSEFALRHASEVGIPKRVVKVMTAKAKALAEDLDEDEAAKEADQEDWEVVKAYFRAKQTSAVSLVPIGSWVTWGGKSSWGLGVVRSTHDAPEPGSDGVASFRATEEDPVAIVDEVDPESGKVAGNRALHFSALRALESSSDASVGLAVEADEGDPLKIGYMAPLSDPIEIPWPSVRYMGRLRNRLREVNSMVIGSYYQADDTLRDGVGKVKDEWGLKVLAVMRKTVWRRMIPNGPKMERMGQKIYRLLQKAERQSHNPEYVVHNINDKILHYMQALENDMERNRATFERQQHLSAMRSHPIAVVPGALVYAKSLNATGEVQQVAGDFVKITLMGADRVPYGMAVVSMSDVVAKRSKAVKKKPSRTPRLM